ncbi:antibiotic biosynthesis monooxygenase family protein [Streptomyces chromofuscus]|uniref:Antibiotic biosynthesis monooxygenase n=1 Tax=Streptomyces chromofuscus TaxID=42881 RepID=A0A7M2SZB0_STRCW|nr:antibiotic biosynthesis monooxygenase family protein [Streptomyces chromofuscus]QOV41750.1 antibiotic biosynthesis monooxygenase [Streptomyces chromofuscus]GGS88749.1 antibiotic biosynthesis monooxygenase [Streptomyces chromofuscus]
MSGSVETVWPLTGASPGHIVVLARWSPAPGSQEDIRALLPDLVRASRSEPGCLGYQLFHPEGDGGDILLVERYADRAAMDAHRASPHFRDLALGRIVPLLRDRHMVVTTVG